MMWVSSGTTSCAAATLDQIRSGIDAQAAAVASLVEQSSAGIGRTGSEAAESLAANVSQANVAIDTLTSRIAEQDRASQRIVAETGRALMELDQHFSGLAETGDQRAAAFARSITRARGELQQLSQETSAQDNAVEVLVEHPVELDLVLVPDDEIIPVGHFHSRQAVGVHHLVLADDLVEEENN